MTLVFAFLVLSSIGVAYYRYMVQENFLVKYQTPCDPATEVCFVYECDSEADECTGDPEEDTTYYNLMYRLAKNIPACDVNVERDCDKAYSCPAGEDKCEMVVCNDDTSLEEEASCTNPEDFVIEEDEDMTGEVMEGGDSETIEEAPEEVTEPAQTTTEAMPAPAMELTPSTPPTTEPGLERL